MLGFLSSVFASSFAPIGNAFALWGALLALVLAFLGLLERDKLPTFLMLALFLAACAGGIARTHDAIPAEHPALANLLGKQIAVEGVLVEALDAREASTRLSIETRRVTYEEETIEVRTGVLAVAPPHVRANYGDVVHATGTLRLPRAFETGEGRAFNYPAYLAKDGISYELAFAEVQSTGANRGSPFKAGVLAFKERYLAGLGATLPEPAAGLAGGITIGDKRSIGPELSEVFRNVGLIHIIVLSGYNITIVINGLARFFWRTPRIIQLGLAGLIAVFFVVISGGAASASRAGAMTLIAVFARMTGRLYLAARVLGIVAVTMVFWNPLLLAFDPGFQLSMLATLGLIFFTPLFEKYLPWVTEKFHFREIFASTLGTQLAVLPLLLYQNGLFPVFSLPANLFALVAVPLAMLFSSMSAVGGMLVGPLALPLALPAYALLGYIIQVAEFFNSLPLSSLSLPAFPAWVMFALYGLLFTGWWYLKRK